MCSWGSSLSININNATPQIKPNGMISKSSLPPASSWSFAGSNNEKNEAATIIPAELPRAIQMSF